MLSKIISGLGHLLRRANASKEATLRPIREATLLPARVVANSRVAPLVRDVAEVSSSTVASPNPIMDALIGMLREDGASEKVIQQFLNHERPRMYRFIGRDELERVLKGETVKSTRPCHNGTLTDITSNPDYGKILKEGKYRVTFRDNEDFAPFSLEPATSRVSIHALKNEEYYLQGGYSLADIEKIEAYSGGDYTHFYP